MIQHTLTTNQLSRTSTGTVIVTGASSGIGREIANQLASRGYRVIAIGRDEVRLNALAAGHRLIEPVVADIGAVDGLGTMIDDFVRRFGNINALVNNAAIQIDSRICDTEYTNVDIAREIAINLTAPITLTRCLLPHLQSHEKSSIVNVTSGLAFVPKRTSAVYSATKAGMHLFTEALRVQMKGSNVRVVEAVMPMVDTPMTTGRGSGKIAPAAAAKPVVDGLWAGPERLYIGKARLLPPLLRFAPGVASRLFQRM